MLWRATQRFPMQQTPQINFTNHSNLHTGYKHSFYHDKQDKFDELFDKYHFTLLKYIDHPELIQEWKKNIDAGTYEKNLNRDIKLP